MFWMNAEACIKAKAFQKKKKKLLPWSKQISDDIKAQGKG